MLDIHFNIAILEGNRLSLSFDCNMPEVVEAVICDKVNKSYSNLYLTDATMAVIRQSISSDLYQLITSGQLVKDLVDKDGWVLR